MGDFDSLDAKIPYEFRNQGTRDFPSHVFLENESIPFLLGGWLHPLGMKNRTQTQQDP
jgi:hypothetical protein